MPGLRGVHKVRRGALTGAAALACAAALLATPAAAGEEPADSDAAFPAGATLSEGVDQSPATDGATEAGPETAPDATVSARSAAATSASSGPPSDCIGRTAAYGSSACFVPDGDVVWVLDTEKDGMSAAAGIYTDYGRAPEACLNKSGVNHWVKCDFDYSEKGRVQLRAFRYDTDTDKFYVPEAYSDWLPVNGRY
ncbi:hypothetical protein [Streptomyces sp. NPDC007088]|uniref:hypothetical protein n=1 Tax=Streptomyces sp. NPDC007088 TaxID=3364773 RepID=UPI00367F7454